MDLVEDLFAGPSLFRRQRIRVGKDTGLVATWLSTYDLAADVASHRLKHHLSRYPVPGWVPVPSAAWVHQQVYLHPYPKELMLRNHV